MPLPETGGIILRASLEMLVRLRMFHPLYRMPTGLGLSKWLLLLDLPALLRRNSWPLVARWGQLRLAAAESGLVPAYRSGQAAGRHQPRPTHTSTTRRLSIWGSLHRKRILTA